jgi:hypothetical protein
MEGHGSNKDYLVQENFTELPFFTPATPAVPIRRRLRLHASSRYLWTGTQPYSTLISSVHCSNGRARSTISGTLLRGIFPRVLILRGGSTILQQNSTEIKEAVTPTSLNFSQTYVR